MENQYRIRLSSWFVDTLLWEDLVAGGVVLEEIICIYVADSTRERTSIQSQAEEAREANHRRRRD